MSDLSSQKSEIEIPFCHKCGECMMQQDLFGSEYHYPAGCNLLTKEQWENGWRKDPEDQIVFQHNCPLLKTTFS